MNELAQRLLNHCAQVPPTLLAFSEETLRVRPAPDKWSKKEIIGHLVDSASNNHQRFVRAMRGEQPVIRYEQDDWVSLQRYQTADSRELVGLWELYNRHLAYLIAGMSEADLKQTLVMGVEQVTLRYCAEDYVRHLEHHLHQAGVLTT
ncbi:MAG: DinB family protein [Saprospiraceae bacterium]|jgi:hypothetical protein|nr:DinB family protein [Saprospiraceae bacterium]